MSNETYCDFDKDTLTRLSCVSCGKAICPKCMVDAPVGFKCPECASANKTHVELIATKQYLVGGLSGLIVGTGTGFIWYYLGQYGMLISLAIAYAVGFCVSRAIAASIGSKIGLKIKIFTGIITFISMAYNPIIIALSGVVFPVAIILMSMSMFSLYKILALVIAIWAAIRHFNM